MHDDSQARGLSVLVFSFRICCIFRKLSYWYSRKSSIWMNWDFYKAGGENWPILSSYSKKEEICDQIYNLAGLCPIFQQWSRNSFREKFRELRFLPKYISSMYIIQADHPHHLDHADLMYHWDHPGHLDWQLTDLENNCRIKKFSFTYVQHKFAKNNLTGMTNYKIWNMINNNKLQNLDKNDPQ